ncbi:MAG: hypothetical protein ACJ71Y_13965 [Blastococcus sp.]
MSTNRNTTARIMHDLGAAAWFGGSLMGCVGVNGAAADVRDPIESTRVAQAGWGRWTPVNLAAIAAHLTGGAIILWGNKGRLGTQRGVLGWSIAKSAVTAGALGVTAYTRILGEQVMRAGDVPSEGGTTPHPATPPKVAAAERQLHVLQWGVPALTGTIIMTSAYMGEQQRPTQVSSGLLQGLGRAGKSIAAGALVAQAATTAAVSKRAAAVAAGKGAGRPGTTSWATKAAGGHRSSVRSSR